MVAAAFAHVRVWVFDLDNTLYPPGARLFDQIEVRMTDWVARELGLPRAEADALRDSYWQRYGTTLAGLMAEHGVDPAPYLDEVHDIDLSALAPDAVLAGRIAALPGRKIVYTNGCEPYARRVLAARGLTGAFDAVYGVEHAGFRPKPERAAFEDDPRNLAVPHALGMRTVLVAAEPQPLDHIHHHATDLSAFLSQLG